MNSRDLYRVESPQQSFHLRVPASLKYLVFEVLAKVLCIKLNKEKKRKSKAPRPGGELEEIQPGCVFCLASPSAPPRDTGRSKYFHIWSKIFSKIKYFPSRCEVMMPVSVMQCSLGRVADRIGAALDIHHR